MEQRGRKLDRKPACSGTICEGKGGAELGLTPADGAWVLGLPTGEQVMAAGDWNDERRWVEGCEL